MTSLRAIHMAQFRNDDPCHCVMRESKKFMADIVTHNPKMKLEYISLDQSVERLVRRSRPKSTKKDKKGKGKANETTKVITEALLGSNSTWADAGASSAPPLDWQASSDEEAEAIIVGKLGLKVETIEGIRFCDVTGVRIFEKDVIGGRL
jgi:hypothetical protein